MVFTCSVSYGQNVPSTPANQGITLDTNTYLAAIALLLLIPILALSRTFISTAKHYYSNKIKSGNLKLIVPLGFILACTSLFGEGTTPSASPGVSGNVMTFLLLMVIGAELILLVFFAQKTSGYIRKIELNAGNISEEFDLFHWLKEKWVYTLSAVIILLAAGIFLYQRHLNNEFEKVIAMKEARHDEFIRTVANSINESNVTIMTAADIEAGKKTFKSNCAICHKSDGGGLVGPNLTDDYWLHGGTLKEIFHTITNGYPDKGMLPWKTHLSSLEIAQVANYILTLRGTNPPDCKAKQGILFLKDVASTDTLSSKKSKVKLVAKK